MGPSAYTTATEGFEGPTGFNPAGLIPSCIYSDREILTYPPFLASGAPSSASCFFRAPSVVVRLYNPHSTAVSASRMGFFASRSCNSFTSKPLPVAISAKTPFQICSNNASEASRASLLRFVRVKGSTADLKSPIRTVWTPIPQVSIAFAKNMGSE
ncbi:MAG: hypothetical protein BWY82_02905 [Verrucomicrobia bacterium ADurb.Bin474]|nr:MAG: hypothetical protein BWY82_02905 [Verrucomicrobia bacterium ADurb.Bin474]